MKYRRVQQSNRYQHINGDSTNILGAIESPPQCHSWDDFLDFSRMSVSSITQDLNGISIVRHRMNRNISTRFQGNYIRIWLLAVIAAGLLQDFRLIISAVSICGIWSSICLLTVNSVADHRSNNTTKKNLKTYSLTLGERSKIFLATSHLMLFMQGTLQQTYEITLMVGILVLLHSVSRPLAIELGKRNTPKVVASDGFLDSDEGEETLVFSSVSEDVSNAQVPPKASPGIIRRIRDGPNNTSDSTTTCIRRHAAKTNVAVKFAGEDKFK